MQQRTLIEFSAQEVVDCSSSFGNQGCTGGTMVNAFTFIEFRGILIIIQVLIVKVHIPIQGFMDSAGPNQASSR